MATKTAFSVLVHSIDDETGCEATDSFIMREWSGKGFIQAQTVHTHTIVNDAVKLTLVHWHPLPGNARASVTFMEGDALVTAIVYRDHSVDAASEGQQRSKIRHYRWTVMVTLENYCDSLAGPIDLTIHLNVVAESEQRCRDQARAFIKGKYKTDNFRIIEPRKMPDVGIASDTFRLR